MRTIAWTPLILLVVAGCGGGGGSSSSSGSGSGSGSSSSPPVALVRPPSGGTADEQAAIARLNSYRAQANVLPAALNDALDTSSTRHAGYQAIRGGITHYESVSGDPGGAPNTANPLFLAVSFDDRIRAANGGANLIASGFYFEDIASTAGPEAIDQLWDTVYHRLPMMRHQTAEVGYGDQALARALYPAQPVPAGSGDATCDFAAPDAARTLSYWPSNGATGIGTTFDTDTEEPDPIDAGNPYQNPHTPTQDTVGTPIHLIAPTLEAWSSITATVTPGGGSPIALFLLSGFPAGPDGLHLNLANPNVPAPPAGADCCDGFLWPGEIFLIPKAPLAPATTYAVHIHAVTASSSSVDQSWSFSTAP